MPLTTSTRRADAVRAWLLRRFGDLLVLAAGFGLALPFLVPLT